MTNVRTAERENCDICGERPVRAIVEGRALCEEHRAEWLRDEAAHAGEEQIRRVMSALDEIAEEPIDGDWNNHLRKMAVRAIEAAYA